MKTGFFMFFLNFQEVKNSEGNSEIAEPKLEELPLSYEKKKAYIYIYIYIIFQINHKSCFTPVKDDCK